MKPYEEMKLIDITNMCSHLQQKLFDEEGEYHRIWPAMQDDPELTAVVRSRQLHIYRNEKHPEGELSTADFKSNKAKKVLVQGELTIIAQDGTEKVVLEGEAVVEMVGTVHHGENRGTKSAILYMFYLSQKGVPLSIQHSENK